MPTNPKIDEQAVQQASESLHKVVAALADFEKNWKILNPLEQVVTGGIVFNLHSLWTDQTLIGMIAPPSFATALLNRLIVFHDTPPRLSPSVIATEDKKESN